MAIKYTLKNSNGATLKYAFNDRFIFNGENQNARKDVTLTVAKYSTAKKLLEKALSMGLTNIEIIEIETKNKTKNTEEIIEEINDEKNEENIDPEYLFNELNEKCLNCTKECKQSSKAKILKCKDFERK